MGGETANGDGGKTVGDGVEGLHAGQPVGEGAAHGEAHVDEPQGARGFGDARREFGVLHRARRFGAVELHATHAQHRQDRHRQHDDAHAAQPLQLLAVVQNTLGQGVQAHQYGGAGGGQPGHGFEHRLRHAQARVEGHEQRDGAEQPQHRPEQHHHQKAVAQFQIGFQAAHRDEGQRSGQQCDQRAQQEAQVRGLAVDHAHRDGRQHGQREDHQQQADDALHRREAMRTGVAGNRHGAVPA